MTRYLSQKFLWHGCHNKAYMDVFTASSETSSELFLTLTGKAHLPIRKRSFARKKYPGQVLFLSGIIVLVCYYSGQA